MGAKASKLAPEEEARIYKRCTARRAALAACRHANAKDAPVACERLEAAVVMCLAGELPSAKGASAEHERCFQSLMNTGRAPSGRPDCHTELAALRAALTKHGLVV